MSLDKLQISPLEQSVLARHCTQECGEVAVSQTCAPAGQSLFEPQPVGGGTMQLLLEEHWLACPLQSELARHCTQELPEGLCLQSGCATGQSCACVAVVQMGTQDSLASQRSPAGHCAAAVHWTQVPESQCGRRGSVQSLSLEQATEMQTFPVLQICPLPQSLGQDTPLPHWPARRQATHLLAPPLTMAQWGSAALLAQPESLVHTVAGAWQV